jgi:hypothetical protein
MCSDDRCLCTSDVIYKAGVCSDCVGDSGRGQLIGTCCSGQPTEVATGDEALTYQSSRTHVNSRQWAR